MTDFSHGQHRRTQTELLDSHLSCLDNHLSRLDSHLPFLDSHLPVFRQSVSVRVRLWLTYFRYWSFSFTNIGSLDFAPGR